MSLQFIKLEHYAGSAGSTRSVVYPDNSPHGTLSLWNSASPTQGVISLGQWVQDVQIKGWAHIIGPSVINNTNINTVTLVNTSSHFSTLRVGGDSDRYETNLNQVADGTVFYAGNNRSNQIVLGRMTFYSVATAASGPGSISSLTNTFAYGGTRYRNALAGSTVVTATAAADAEFVRWVHTATGQAVVTGGGITVSGNKLTLATTLAQDISVTAEFRSTVFAVSAVASSALGVAEVVVNGVVKPQPFNARNGDRVTVRATAGVNAVFIGWRVTGHSPPVPPGREYTFEVNQNLDTNAITFTADFTQMPQGTLTVEADVSASGLTLQEWGVGATQGIQELFAGKPQSAQYWQNPDEPLVVFFRFTAGGPFPYVDPSRYSVSVAADPGFTQQWVGTHRLVVTVPSTAAVRTVKFTVTPVFFMGDVAGTQVWLTRNPAEGHGEEKAREDSGTVASRFGDMTVSGFAPGQSVNSPLTVTVTPRAGYTPRLIACLDADDESVVTAQFPCEPGVTQYTVTPGFAAGQDGHDVIVRLVVEADAAATPVVTGMTEADNGMFEASRVNATDPSDMGFRVGDTLRLTVQPPLRDGLVMQNVIVCGIRHNGTVVSIAPDVTVVANIEIGTDAQNVIYVAMAARAVLLVQKVDGSPVSPPPSPPPVMEVSGQSFTVGGQTYYRLGETVALAVPMQSGASTAISVTHQTQTDAAGAVFGLVRMWFLDATGALSLTLLGNDRFVVAYADGLPNPYACVAVYSYDTGAYVTSNIPQVGVEAVGLAELGGNEAVFAPRPPPPLVNPPPDDGFWEAAAVIRKEVTGMLLPSVRLSISAAGVAYALEVWDEPVGAWVPFTGANRQAVLAVNGYFRFARGIPPGNRVTVFVRRAVWEETDAELHHDIQPRVSLLTSTHDSIGTPELSAAAVKGSPVSLYAYPVRGAVFSGWRDGEGAWVARTAAAQVRAGQRDTSFTPVYAVAGSGASDAVMVLGGDRQRTAEGLWVSREFRAQWPWGPSAAVVVREDYGGMCQLLVVGGQRAKTDRGILDEVDGTAEISVDGPGMRRLPPAPVQRDRFHRVALLVTGGAVSSVAVASGAETLKGGH